MQPTSADAPAPWRTHIDDALALGIPARAGAPRLRRKIQIVTLLTGFLTGIGLIFAARYLWYGGTLVTLCIVTAIAVGLANLGVLRLTQNTQIAGIIGTGVVFLSLLVGNLFSGGFDQPSFGAFYLVPVLAMRLVDARAGWAFAAVVLVATVGFWGVDQAGLGVPNVVPADARAVQGLMDRASAILVAGVVVGAFVAREPTVVDDADIEPTDAVPRSKLGPDPEPPTAPLHEGALRVMAVDVGLAGLLWIQTELSEHEVQVTTDAREALARFLAEDFDVLLCGLALAGWSGDELHAALRKHAPDRASRIVFVADPHAPPTPPRGATVLRKPLDPDDLRRALVNAARRAPSPSGPLPRPGGPRSALG